MKKCILFAALYFLSMYLIFLPYSFAQEDENAGVVELESFFVCDDKEKAIAFAKMEEKFFKEEKNISEFMSNAIKEFSSSCTYTPENKVYLVEFLDLIYEYDGYGYYYEETNERWMVVESLIKNDPLLKDKKIYIFIPASSLPSSHHRGVQARLCFNFI